MDDKIIKEISTINEKMVSLLKNYEKESIFYNESLQFFKITESKLQNDSLLTLGQTKKVVVFSQNSNYKTYIDFEENFVFKDELELDLDECQNIMTIHLNTLLNFKYDNMLSNELHNKLRIVKDNLDWNYIAIFVDFKSDFVEYFIDIIRNFNGKLYNIYLKESHYRKNRGKYDDYNFFLKSLRMFFYISELTPIFIQINNQIKSISSNICDEVFINDEYKLHNNNDRIIIPTEFFIVNINE